MSMSTRIVGFRPADGQWKLMKKAWEACESAGIPVGHEIQEFFGYEPPDDRQGMEVALGDSCTEYSAEGESGYEIDVSKLPENVTVIRVLKS